jgi:heme/copper-type cytochrome/quinol oxidase subunit 2
MSTDIVRFQNNGHHMHKFSGLALGVYLAITVPIMLFTFWAAFSYRRREAKLTAQKRAETYKTDAEQGLLIGSEITD